MKMSLEKVYKCVDAHADDFVEDLVKLIKQPSVSVKGTKKLTPETESRQIGSLDFCTLEMFYM